MRILLADDHAMVRDGLVPFLERLQPGVAVVEAASFAEAQEAARSHPDLELAILDLYMPGMGGVSGLIALRREFPNLPIVILSGSTSPEDALRAMENGASGFVPKTMRGETILGVLRLVLSGERYIPPFLLEYRDNAPQSASPPVGAPLAQITPRERDILEMVVDGAPNKVIARELNLQEVTVKAHLRNMFRKLNVANRTEAARIALLAGVSGRRTLEDA